MNNTPISSSRGQVQAEVDQLTRRHAVLLMELEWTPPPGNPPQRRHRSEILADFRLCVQQLQRWFVWLHYADDYERRLAPPPRRTWLSAAARACIRDAAREDVYYLQQRGRTAA